MAAHEIINSQSLIDVANSILEKHRGSVAPRIEDAIAHAVYLYGLPPSIQSQLCLDILWLYDEQGHAAKGDDLYIHNPKSKNGPDILHYTTFPVRFLSQKYTMTSSLNQNGPEFIPWLTKKTRLTDFLRISKSGGLTPEFKFLMKWYPDRVCDILKDFWHLYQHDINHSIREEIAEYMVYCFDQIQGGIKQFHKMPLKDSCIESSELKTAISSLCNARAISMLPVKPVTSAYDEWKFLSIFGVKVTANLDFYLWLGAQSQFKASCGIVEAKRFLSKIAYLIQSDHEKQFQARKSFNTTPLIYLPRSHGDTWVLPTQCAWDGPTFYTTKHFLKPVYEESVDGTDHVVLSFIRNTLRIRDITVWQVIIDLQSEEPSDAKLLEACDYMGAKIQNTPEISLDELVSIRDAFAKNRWIPVPEDGIQVRSFPANCVWGGPKLSFKFNLEPLYKDNSNLCHLFHTVLNIDRPNQCDLLIELQLLKRFNLVVCESIEKIYASIFNGIAKSSGGTQIQDNRLRNDFERHALVYTNGSKDEIHWCKPSDCAWDSTHIVSMNSDMMYRYTPNDASAVSFLRTTLAIKNASPMQYIAKLRSLQQATSVSKEQVEDIYRCIKRSMANQDSEIRRDFESQSLIYDHVHKPPRWVPLSDCVWTWMEISNSWKRTNLALCYPSLKVFFIDDLHVWSPSLSLSICPTKTPLAEKVENLVNFLKDPQKLENQDAEIAIKAPFHKESGPNLTDTEVSIFPKIGPQGAKTSQLALRGRQFVASGSESNMILFTAGPRPLVLSASKSMAPNPRSSASIAIDSTSRFDCSSLISTLELPSL